VDEPDPHPLFGRELTPGQLVALDAGVAVAYTLLLLSFVTGRAGPLPVAARCAVVAGIGLPLAVRRLRPRVVFAVVLAASLASALGGVVNDSFAGAAVALYAVAVARPRRRWEPTLAIGAASAAVAVGGALVGPAGTQLAWLPLDCAVLGGAWTVGRAVRERRAYAARAAAELADRATADERLRIARELHDIVAHSMSLIAVKAGVANHVAGERPEEARDALRVIEATSRSALAEMRRLLGVLRPDHDTASLAPASGTGDLRELADRAAMAGVQVSLDVRGLERVPEGVGLSVYRIVQEALTNVVRHAAPARCLVAVVADGHAVAIEVTDDGPGRRVLPAGDGPGRGHGLMGMRERAATSGGAFTAGPRPEGGFRVWASLPYEPLEELR
jgi:signal transduction histidine kinase